MGKLIQLTEAARRLGLTDQTLRNWVKKGALNIKRVGKAHYVDEDTIMALQDTAEDIARQQKALRRLRDAEAQELREFHEAMRDKESRKRYYALCVGSGIRTDFFATICDMLQTCGQLSIREAEILKKRLYGDTLGDICQDYGLTRERVREISEKAIRKSKELTWLKEKLEHIRELETDRAMLKAAYAGIKEKLRQQQELDRKEAELDKESKRKALMEQDALCKLLLTKLIDCELSVRALNILRNGHLDCQTIGDVAKLHKIDFLRCRNVGKKTITEVDDFLHSKGLEWGIDVDAIYQQRMEILMSSENPV